MYVWMDGWICMYVYEGMDGYMCECMYVWRYGWYYFLIIYFLMERGC